MRLAQTPDEATAPAPSFVDVLKSAIPAAMQLYREQRAIKLQMKRAELGLPPLPVEDYTPPVRVEGSIDKRTMLLGVGAAVAIALGLMFMGKGARRSGRRRRA